MFDWYQLNTISERMKNNIKILTCGDYPQFVVAKRKSLLDGAVGSFKCLEYYRKKIMKK